MEIVIKIPEEDYIKISNSNPSYADDFNLYYAIKNGTPLPEYHGDLIDRDSLELDSDWSDYYDGFSAYSESQVRLAPTIIEGSESE
jgi:hypothetical protein